MRLIALDDLWMDDLTLHARPLITSLSERLGFATRRRDGVNGSHFVRVVPETARWDILFQCDDEASRDALLAALGGDVTEERRLLAERDDIASTRVVAYAVPVKIHEPNQLDLRVEFEGMDSVWVSETATETEKSFTNVLDRAMHIDVPGNTKAAPTIILTPQTQRTTSAGANVGWRFRRRATITNNSDVPWFREPCRISMGSTTAAVTAGNMQADGDDVRLWLDGMEISRTLITWNTSASFIWFIIPALLPGRSLVVDIVYGQGAAVSPPELVYPDRPSFFLSSSTNAVWNYPADEDILGVSGLGIWHLSSSVEPITPDYGVPGSWRPVRTMPNPDNTDVGYQLVFDNDGVADGLARFHAERAIEDTILGPTNDYDGVALYSPLPIIKLRAGFTVTNEHSQWAVNLHYRNSSGEDWAYDSISSSVPGGTIAPADYTLPSPSHHIAVAVGPVNNWQVSAGVTVDETIRARTDEEWTITRDDADMVISLGAEVEIYELATELHIGGGADLTPPYRALLVGNARHESGAGTPRAAVTLSQALVIDAETRTHEVFNDALTAVVERMPAHAVSGVIGWDDNGTTEESPTSEWLPLAPTRTIVPNGDFQADIGGWMAGVSTFGSVVRSWDGTVGGKENGSLKVVVTGADNGEAAETWGAKWFSVNGRESIELAAWSLSTANGLSPRLQLWWGDDDETTVGFSTEPIWNPPVTDTELVRVFAAAVPYQATKYRIGLLVYATTTTSGTVWWDDVKTNDNDLVVNDGTMIGGGTLDVAVAIKGRWL